MKTRTYLIGIFAMAMASCKQTPQTYTKSESAVAQGLPRGNSASDLTPLGEKSGFKQTGTYAEAVQLCVDFQAVYAQKARCTAIGATPQGRPIVALIVAGDGRFDAKDKEREVIYLQAGIHAGEIDGKDAGFMLLRDILAGKVLPAVLQKVTIVFVPVFNVDGHERRGPNNRPHQTGPEETGWRTTAQNLNLNRDFVKTEASETQALLRFLVPWDPIMTIDLHVTDGSRHQNDVAIVVAPSHVGPTDLMTQGSKIRDEVLKSLTEKGHTPLGFYPELADEDDPATGIMDNILPPRFANFYFAGRNRYGVLIETHSWRDYGHRVTVTYDSLVGLLVQAATNAPAWRRAAQRADQEALATAGTSVVLAWSPTDEGRIVPFQGYAYTREPSDVSGVTRTVYDVTKPDVWQLKLFDKIQPTLTVTAPRGGYIVPPEYAALVGSKLAIQGIQFTTVNQAVNAANSGSEVFRAATWSLAKSSSEGRTRATVTGNWRTEGRPILVGSLFVPVNQPLAWLVMAMLEPQAADSLLAWGYFNGIFEQPEYMEKYVAEVEARKMLAQDPQLKAEFDRKLADEAFAKDPGARLEFFYRHHPSWDERVEMYPIMRAPTLGGR